MNPKIKRILFTTDMTPNSDYAFQYAADLAMTLGSEIVVLHVVERIPEYVRTMASAFFTDQDRFEKTLAAAKEHVKKNVDEMCKRLKNEFPNCAHKIIATEVVEGYPVDVILKKVKECNCDAVVMSSHGKGFIGHALLGSVTERVLRRASLPVIIIPLPNDEQ